MSSRSNSNAHLERGRACLRCRRRKMRCDGVKPICGQCARAEVTECEFTDAGPAPSQVLERNVADLEARIRELTEGPPPDTVTLHNPHAAGSSTRPRGTPANPTAAGASRQGQATVEQPDATLIPSPNSPEFLRSFRFASPSLGFFLNYERFMQRIRHSIPPTPQSPIPPSLVYAVVLMDAVHSNNPLRRAKEPQLLALALQNLTSDMSPARILDVLQAELLIACYLCQQNRKLEGMYHITAASSIVIACNLHKIRSARTNGPPSSGLTLAPPRDEIEERERIYAFWITFMFDRMSAASLDTPAVIIDESNVNTQIDTPWPLEPHEYEQGHFPPQARGYQTVQQFLTNPVTVNGPGNNMLSFLIKASILREKAVRLNEYDAPNAPNHHACFTNLDQRLQYFTSLLPSFSDLGNAGPETVRRLLTVKTTCFAAIVELHSPRRGDARVPTERAVAASHAAAALVQSLNMAALGFVDSIVGIMWGAVGQCLVTYLAIMKRSQRTASQEYATATSSLRAIMNAMQACSGMYPVMAHEYAQLAEKAAQL